MAYIILDFSSSTNCDDATSPFNILHIRAAPKAKVKTDAHFLQYILPTAIPFIKSHLASDQSNIVSIVEGCGNDPGTRLDLSVGVAVAAIQLLFDENGDWLGDERNLQGRLLHSWWRKST